MTAILILAANLIMIAKLTADNGYEETAYKLRKGVKAETFRI